MTLVLKITLIVNIKKPVGDSVKLALGVSPIWADALV